MLRGEGMQCRKTGEKQLCTYSTFLLYISLPLFCTTTTWNFQKLLSYMFYGGNVVRVPVHFFSLLLIFTLHWWPLAFLKIFMLFFQQNNVISFGFSSLTLNPCRPFLVELCWPAAHFLFSSVFLLHTYIHTLLARPHGAFQSLLYIPNLWTWQFI